MVPQTAPAALLRRTLEREQLPNGGGSGCPVSEETKETTGVGAIRLVLVCGSVMSRLGWALRMFPQKQTKYTCDLNDCAKQQCPLSQREKVETL